MHALKNEYIILVGKLQVKRPVGRPRTEGKIILKPIPEKQNVG
jgi:hypothetical protein